jgi:alpha-2-macroglobulin
MHKIYKRTTAIILTSLLIFICGCGNERTEEINPAFVGFISGFTSGMVSNETTIKINLAEPAQNVQYAEPIDDDLFDFSPNIDGEAFWVDENTIEFRPEERLPSGTHYKAEFDLSEIVDVPSDLKTFYFDFETIKQGVKIEFAGVRAYDNSSLEWQELTFQLTTADYANLEALEEVISATQKGKNLKTSWDHSQGNKVHYFTVDSVARTKSRGEVIINWDGKIIDSEEQGTKQIEIPALDEFKVIDIKIEQQPEQSVIIYFSDPVDPKQDLDGLIYLKTGEDLRLAVDENSITAYPSKRLDGTTTLTVDKAIKNTINYGLMEGFKREITFTNLKPKVELIGEGVILPNTDGLIFPFKTVNLSALNVKVIKIFEKNVAQFFQVNQFDGTREMKRVGRIVHKGEIKLTSSKSFDYGSWNTFSLDLSTLINAEPGAIYRVELSFDKKHSLYPCGDAEEELEVEEEDREEEAYDKPSDYYYDDYYYDYYDDYDWRERENPCSKSYYLRNNTTVAKNFFVSDLGIIAKGGNGNTLTVAITDIKTTEPLSGVNVEIYNYQNQLMKSTTTGSDGLIDIELDKKPFLLVAKQGNQTGYLRLDDGSSLSLSMFDVGGVQTKKGLKGFIYGERGVWRPGDSLFVSFILEDKNRVLPINHPVVMELYTPDNQLFSRKVKTVGENGFYDFRTKTDDDSPTGNWLAKVKVGGSSFTKTIKIESIKPNRLKIKMDFDGEIIKDDQSMVGDLEVKWLHGAIAGNIKTDVELILTSSTTKFKDYPDYSFDDPSKDFNSEEKIIFDGKLNSEGKASVYPKINVGKSVAPGMLNANFKIRAFENGGNFSIDRFTVPYSTYRGYVGVKVPEGKGWNGALYSNEPNLIPIVTVDENGKSVDRKRLKVEIFDVYWRWWWERSDRDDLSRYVANRSKNLIKEEYINTVNGKAIYELKFDKEYWGRKFIKITDPETGHSTGQTFYLTYKGWWDNNSGDNPGGAEMLTFSCDKKTYNVGEELKFDLPPTAKGRALVSIESGSKVIERKWVEIAENKNTFTFEATAEMTPNVYVNVSLIQPHNQVANDLPIRLYGVQPIFVEHTETHLEPVIKMPEELAPESEVQIKVSEKDGKKMTYTIAIVDEGLLDLTRFKTPNPWETFYAREALGIKTWDLYKYVMNAFSGEMAGLLALGGDDNVNPNSGPKANRFKPVVLFKGPFTIEKGSSKTHKFQIPNYVGSVRTMVVAGNDGAYGSSEKATPVKKPLMVLATLPRTLSPNEKVKLPVTVFAMDKKVKNVAVQIQTNKLLKVNGSATQNITFTREGDEVVEFDIDVAEAIGIGKVKVIAKSGNEIATYDFELNIKPANPEISEVISATVEPNQKWNTDYQPIGMKGTNKGVVEVSKIPSINLQKRLKYLIQYPHGCIEQTTSSVFPQLFLENLIELDNNRKAEIESNIREGINRLKKFQLTEGGMSYWPGNEDANEWGTNYAGHFMLEAQKKGYSLPSGFLSKWIKFQKRAANAWSPKTNNLNRYYSYRSDQLIQAYRLYTLALAGKPALGAMNRMKEVKNLSPTAKWRLAAAYELAGKSNVAKNIVQNISTEVEAYKELSFSYGSKERDQAMILETLVLMKEKSKAQGVLKDISKGLSSESWYSTQTTAYSLMAIAKFIGVTGEPSDLSYDVYQNGKKLKSVSTKASISQTAISIKTTESGNIQVMNKTGQTLFIKVHLEGIPLEGDNTSSENNLKMDIRYLSMDEREISVDRLAQGTDFIAEVTITHPGLRTNYEELALNQIFPSGWEIRNTRMDLVETTKVADKPEYMDIRDDRVYSYFDLNKYKTKRFRILLNASYLGKFYLPTVYCEAMYDNEINSRKGGKWIEVVKGGE